MLGQLCNDYLLEQAEEAGVINCVPGCTPLWVLNTQGEAPAGLQLDGWMDGLRGANSGKQCHSAAVWPAGCFEAEEMGLSAGRPPLTAGLVAKYIG